MRANEVGVPRGRASMDALVAARRTGGGTARARAARGLGPAKGGQRDDHVMDGGWID